MLFLKLFYLCFIFFIPADGWRIILKSFEYLPIPDESVFVYELTEPSASNIVSCSIDIPTCTEVTLVGASTVAGQGLDWTETKTDGSVFTVTAQGYIKSGSRAFTIVTASGVPLTGLVEGPVCESVPVLVCDAGTEIQASCGDRVALSGQGCQHATQYIWTVASANSAVVITQHNTDTPTVDLPTNLCSNDVIISLTVQGPEGQTKSCNIQIEVSDSEYPKLVGLYADDTEVDCDDIPAPSIVTATDNCGPAPVVSYSESNVDSIITRTWSAVDQCGLSIDHVQTITVRDTVPPTLIGAPTEDATHSCHVVPAPCEVTAYDNCDTSITVSETETKLAGSCDGTFKIVRTWSAQDTAGLTTSAEQTLTFSDDEEPELIGVPEDLQIHCGALPDVPVVTAVDNCATEFTVTMSETQIDLSPPPNDYHYSVIRRFSAIDRCGNVGSKDWTIVIHDEEAPHISGVDPDKTVNCADIPAPCEVIVIDNCDTSLVAVLIESTLEGSCPNSYTITRRWTAVDANGNTAEETQVIHVVDTTKPKFTTSLAPEVFATCDFVPNNNLDATDVCGPVTVLKSTETINSEYTVIYTVIHTWVATDECGLTNTKVQTIHVDDAVPPTMSGLPAAYVSESCSAAINDPLIVVSDNCPDCDPVLVSGQEKVDGSCVDEYILERTWTATDCGGHIVSYIQTISISDSEPPKLTGLSGHLIVPIGSVPDVNPVVATDNCDEDVSVTVHEHSVGGSCAYEFVVVRDWEAVDDCGSAATHTQTIEVVDNQPPVFNQLPQDLLVQCRQVIDSHVTATDNSGASVTVILTETTIPGSCTDEYSLVRLFTASDICGNVITQVQTIAVHDTEAPIIISGDGFQSHVLIDHADFQAPTNKLATDLCDPNVVPVQTSNTVPTDCSNDYTVYYSWTAVDRCGNEAAPIDQTIAVHDNTVPIFNIYPASTTIQCDELPYTAPPVTCSDPSSGHDVTTSVTYSESTIDVICVNGYKIVRSWSSQDCIGNVAQHSQTITVEDTSPPVISAPPDDTTVSCGGIPVGSPDDVSADDNCDLNILVAYSETTSSVDETRWAIVRTWTVVDTCSNAASQHQVIVVEDTVSPTVLEIPADITVQCDSPPPAAGGGSCEDDCDESPSAPTFSETYSVPQSCSSDGVIQVVVRSWTCVDSSNNPDTVSQTITIVDEQDPVFMSQPNPLTISCDTEVPAAPEISANDCDQSLTVTPTSRTVPGQTNNDYSVIYKWVAVDACGNEDEIEQTITVKDIEAPTLTLPPVDAVNCSSTFTRPTLVPDDNCDSDPSIYATTVTNTGSCLDRYSVVYTWVTQDVSGNAGTELGMSHVVDDNDAPTILTQFPPTLTISYTDLSQHTTLSLVLQDNCDPNPTSTCTRHKTELECAHEYTLIDTCNVTDRCGNSEIVERTINVRDDVPPQIGGGVPVDGTYECPLAAPPAPDLSSEVGITVEFTQLTISQTCINTYTVERTWTAEDCVHNSATVTQIIVMQDTQPPVLSPIPADVTKDCPFCIEDAGGEVTATDTCDANVQVVESTVTLTENLGNEVVIIYIRTWTATDQCLNSAQGVQTITVVDTADPELVNVPSSSSIPVGPNNVPSIPTNVQCVDDCDTTTLTFYEAKTTGSCPSQYLLTRTWDCTDVFGHSVTAVRIINVLDSVPPVLGPLPLPANVILDGDDLPNQATLVATDTVDSVVMVVPSQIKVSGADENNYELLRSWSASDGCGNNVEYVQTVTITPAPDPLIPTVPTHYTTECDDPPTHAQDVSLTQSIELQVKAPGVTVSFSKSTQAGTCPGSYKVIRTWTAEDPEMNSISDWQSIEVVDHTPPSFDTALPQPYVTVECDSVQLAEVLTATDLCGPAIVAFSQNTHTAIEYILTRDWIATDECGNSATHTSMISVEDHTPPTFSTFPLNLDYYTVPCEFPCEFPMNANVEVADNCGIATYTCEASWILNPCTRIKRVSCIGEDAAGNTATQYFDETYYDNAAPVLSDAPDDLSIDCQTPVPTPGNVDVTEPCEVLSSATLNVGYFTLHGLSVIVRTWTATDQCGQTSGVVQTITLTDTTPPTLYNIPSDTTVNCDADAVPSNVHADDDCGSVTIINTVLRSDGDCSDNFTLVKTWTATDSSGLTTSAQSTVVVVDDVAPVFSGLPSSDFEDITAQCNLVPPPPPAVAVVDNCDQLAEHSYLQVKVGSNTVGEEYWLIRTWTATDTCENSVEFVQTVHVVIDTDAPTLTSTPVNQHLTCSDIVPYDDPTVEDNCDDGLTVTKTETIIQGSCPNNYQIIRVWSSTDSFGNSASVDQTIFVTDENPPALIGVPDTVAVACSSVPDPAVVTAVDQCNQDTTVTLASRIEDSVNPADYTLIYTWTGFDSCGNGYIDEQTIYVDDSSAPEFSSSFPSDTTVVCHDQAPPVPDIQVTDDCSDVPVVSVNSSDTQYDCTNSYVTVTTWTVSDDSGNDLTRSWKVTVIDESAPIFVVGPDVSDATVQCTPPPLLVLEANDNCDSSVLVNVYDETITNGNHPVHVINVLARTYSATDTCGHRVEILQTITIIDDVPPSLSNVPADTGVQCSNLQLELWDLYPVIATDDCTTATVAATSVVTPGTCDQEYTKTYSYHGYDENGNVVDSSFVVSVYDNQPPLLSNIPQWSDVTFECDTLPTVNDTAAPIAEDSCEGTVAVQFDFTVAEHGAGTFSYAIDYVWTTVDDCGNSDSKTATVQVSDSINPQLICTNQDCSDMVVECGGVPNVPHVNAVDNCDTDIHVAFSEGTVTGSCSSQYALSRTWTATDNSGNTNSISQVITVQSTVRPELSFGDGSEPSNVVVDCVSIPDVPTATANHQCEDVTVIYDPQTSSGSCPSSYTVTRTWTVVDCLGMSDSHVQIITVVDNTEPNLSQIDCDEYCLVLSEPISLAYVEVQDIKSTWPGMLSANDDCDGNVPVSFSQTKQGGSCKHEFLLIRVWTVADACGNVKVHDQTVEVTDTTPPELDGIPIGAYYEFELLTNLDPPSTTGVTATDNSQSTMTVQVTEATVVGNCATEYKLVRTWTVQDPCGNSASEDQTITIDDNTPPDIDQPQDETVECDAVPLICDVKVNASPDHPDSSLSVSHVQETLSGNHDYHYQLVRSWWVDDCAGNQASHDQTITVKDTTPPVFTRIYTDETTECDCESNTELYKIDALDNCEGLLVAVTPEQVTIATTSEDAYTVTRTWTSRDSSNNIASYVQTVVVQDETKPEWCEVLALPPTLVYTQCDSVPPHPEIKAQDDCDPAIQVVFSEHRVNGNCDDTFSLTRTWSATDRSGNLLTHETTINVSDSMVPTMINTDEMLCLWPANGMVAVYSHASASLVDVVDNCGHILTSITSCNSTEPGQATSCAYNAASDTLYVEIQATSQAGRTYTVSSLNIDRCANEKVGKKKIYIPSSEADYNTKSNNGLCGGTGANHYISVIPTF